LVAWLVAVCAAVTLAAPSYAQDEFLEPEKAFQFSIAQQGEDTLGVHFKIAPGYYMYRKRFGFETEPASGVLEEPVYPQGTVTYDPTFDEDMEVYRQEVTVLLPIETSRLTQDLTLNITSQGCADQGICYPPQTASVQLVAADGGYALTGRGVGDAVPAPRDEGATDQKADTKVAAAGVVSAGSNTTQTTGLSGALQLTDMGLANLLHSASWLQIMLIALV